MKKIFAITAAVMMMAVAGFALVDSSDSDATTTLQNDTVKVYVVDGNNVYSETVYAYDLYQAVKAVANDTSFAALSEANVSSATDLQGRTNDSWKWRATNLDGSDAGYDNPIDKLMIRMIIF